VGQGFEIYSEGEELKHPVTGQSLGRVNSVSASGVIQSIEPLYSVGRLNSPADIKSGMHARLKEIPSAPAPAPVVAVSGPRRREPRIKGPGFPFPIRAFVVADFSGKGRPELAVLAEKSVMIFSYPPTETKPLAEYSLGGASPVLVSIEAADLNGNGRSELFVGLYNGGLNRFETQMIEQDGQGRWEKLGEIPGLVRRLQDETGTSILAAQQLIEDPSFPFAGVYPLVFREGRYETNRPALKHFRADWLFSFNRASVDGRPALLYFTPAHRLRVLFEKGDWSSSESFGETPIRLRWPRENGRMLEFNPHIETESSAVYLLHNEAGLGGFAEPLGVFSGGAIEKLVWDGVSFNADWKAELGGYATDLRLVGGDLAVSVAGTSGQSAIWVFDP
jgi:hypothetical protein